jgi:1,2-phenylacetyl-CoA epoxidase PaaB subunit
MIMRIRPRKKDDRDYFVRMVNSKTAQRVAVGNFYAQSAGEAIDMARKVYHGLFGGMETNTWSVQAEEIIARRIVAEEMVPKE